MESPPIIHTSTWATSWQIGVRAARANLIPGVILQVAAALTVVAYYRSDSFHALLQQVAVLQIRHGIAFSMLTRSVFNGIVPALFCVAIPGLRVRRPWAALVFGICWWAFMGMITHLFYAFQAGLWGAEAGFTTILLKTATDMLVFSPVVASPLIATVFLWQDQNYSFHATRRQLGRGWYQRIVMPNQVPGWTFWTPGVMILYSLPTALQMPMASLLGCFWALMCLQIARRIPIHQ